MATNIIINGDMANFSPNMPPAVAGATPGQFAGNHTVKVNGQSVCLLADEAQLQVPGISYIQGGFVGGVGTLKIQRLAADQQSKTVMAMGGKPLLLKGSQFIAQFMPQVKANQPFPPMPDPVPIYVSVAPIITTNHFAKAR